MLGKKVSKTQMDFMRDLLRKTGTIFYYKDDVYMVTSVEKSSEDERKEVVNCIGVTNYRWYREPITLEIWRRTWWLTTSHYIKFPDPNIRRIHPGETILGDKNKNHGRDLIINIDTLTYEDGFDLKVEFTTHISEGIYMMEKLDIEKFWKYLLTKT